MIGLEKSFRMMYGNIGLSFRWTLPLKNYKVEITNKPVFDMIITLKEIARA